MRYIPCSESDRKAMLDAMGRQSVEELFEGIPENLRLRRQLEIPAALSEPELLDYFQRAATDNAEDYVSFLGAGVYRHFIPVVIDSLISRSEFYTAYTPYQAEVSQGTLQAIFEFQTYITQLTGQEVANASLYDGSTAVTEAALMAHRVTKRNSFLVASTLHPEYRAVMETYARNLGIQLRTVGYLPSGQLNLEELEKSLDDSIAGVVVQSPNFFGTIENTTAIADLARKHGALSIVGICEAMSLGILRPPSDADIVAGEAQSFGVPMSYGGPHVGFLATRDKYVRQMPGRLVGMGSDHEGRRAFVLTLSTREQHIRREKATSNICTNQSLCALMATIYLATLGPMGLRDVAEQNIRKTDYAVQRIQSQTRHKVLFPGPRFNEFVIQLAAPVSHLQQRLLLKNIIAGVSLHGMYPELGNALLVCVTETTRREQIDALVEGLL
jgi:glycine dehydrogenase subunit 1